MIGVVPAAGQGTRLRPRTADIPKGLVEINSRPLLSYVFDRLVEIDIEELVIIIGYQGDQIRNRFGTTYDGIPITYVEQEPQRGLADAVLQARPVVEGPFVVLNGDNIFGTGLEPVVERFETSDADAVIAVQSVTQGEAERTGVVTPSENGISGLREKPADPDSTLATTGCYVLPENVFEYCARVEPGSTGEYELTEALDRFVEEGYRIEPVEIDGWIVNINTADDIERAEELLET